jgi:hypothetical protein
VFTSVFRLPVRHSIIRTIAIPLPAFCHITLRGRGCKWIKIPQV